MKTITDSQKPTLCLGLFTLYEADIQKARIAFFEHMERYYPEYLVARMRKKLNQRISLSHTPLQGEMWPWFLKRVFPFKSIHEKDFQKLVLEWYALYLAVVIFDDAFDMPSTGEFDILLPLITEAGPLIADTVSSRKAVIGQLQDMAKSPNYEKNAFIECLSKRLGSMSIHPDKKLETLIGGPDMMYLLQALDDIGDVDEDLRHQRPSSIISPKMSRSGHSIFSVLLADSSFDFASTEVAGTLHVISKRAKNLRELLMERNKIVDLAEEITYFSALTEELTSLADYIQYVGNVQLFPTRELKEKMQVLAQST